MTSLDLHPEELFDKAAKGLATPAEQARLDAHLAACATCRFEHQARADFAAVGGEAGDLDDLVARALSGAAVASPAPTAAAGATLGRRRRLGPLLAAAATLVGVASFAAVAQYTGLLPRLLAPKSEVAPPEPPPGSPRRAPRAALVPAPELPATSPPERDSTSQPEASSSLVHEVPPPPLPAPRVVPRPAPVASAPGPTLPQAPASSALAVPAPDEPGALALFTRARDARVRGDTTAALRDLRAVVARFPSAPEAALAHAELGRLLLDRGEPASALEAFDAYLASSHHLLEEDVRGARALALQALGRADDERAAWEAVLRDFPTGVYAPRARTRLEALTR